MMQYRRFGGTGWKVSALGFGCMRLPTTDKKPLSIRVDTEESIRMIRYAIDKGVNYVDNAYPYHRGRSERVLGEALRDGYRDRVKLATKSPVWLIKKGRDFDTYLDEQLNKLKTDHVDLYLFHALNRKTWRGTVLRHGLLKRAERAIEAGKIGKLGFSFHDNLDAFKEIVDGNERWDFCQIQYNYLDTKNQAGTRGLRYAASKGLGVAIMEPLLGGRLANPPRRIRRIMKDSGLTRSPADLGLQWLWNQPEVSVVLSGMSTMMQVRGNIRSAEASGIGSLAQGDLKLIERLQGAYKEMAPIPCTQCSYCMPCPNGVNIPRNFEVYNDAFVHDELISARATYKRFLGKVSGAERCIQCAKCEDKCPQKIGISRLMPQVYSVLGRGQPFPKH